MHSSVLLAALAAFAAVAVSANASQDEPFAESDQDVLYRVPRGARGRDRAGEECRYKKEPWGECDNATNTQKRRLLLKRGSGTCEPTKEVTRTCKKACRYEKGTWNTCDTTANVRTRTDRLKPKSDQNCDQTRTITKKCKNAPAGCRYNRSTRWSECDMKSSTKRKVMPLVNGSPPDCESYKTITKPCRPGKGRKNKQDEEEEDED